MKPTEYRNPFVLCDVALASNLQLEVDNLWLVAKRNGQVVARAALSYVTVSAWTNYCTGVRNRKVAA